MRGVLASCMLLVLAVGCAPTPSLPDATSSADQPPAAPVPRPSAGLPAGSKDLPTAEGSASTDPTSTEPGGAASQIASGEASRASGWSSVDVRVVKAEEVAELNLPSAATTYLSKRLAEPCELIFTVFAAHSDGFLVGEERGVCSGTGLFVYGPKDGAVTNLVEFTSVAHCDELREAGVPAGVPKTRLFPDGLLCLNGSAVQPY